VFGHPTTEAPLMKAADFRIYDEALSDADVMLLAAAGEPSTLPVGQWPMAEGAGTTVYDVSSLANHGTASDITEGTFWEASEPLVHYNVRFGFRLSGSTRIPARHGGLLAADGNAITNPASIGHNDAETLVDFTGGVPEAPWLDPARLGLTVPDSYAFGDALPSGMTKQTAVAREYEFVIE
jgi:hypothetical protein